MKSFKISGRQKIDGRTIIDKGGLKKLKARERLCKHF